MTNYTLMPSLFPKEKGDFDSGHLMSLISQNPQFESWLKLGFIRANEHLNQLDFSMSKRLRSTNLHEFAFNELANSLTSFPSLSTEIDVFQSKAGNQKNFFYFGGYVFILRKEDASTNDTQVNAQIQHQEMNAHVISVEYVVSPMQDSIISLKLSYYSGNQAVFSYNISLSSLVTESSESIEAVEVKPIKPKLSHRALGNNTVG